MALTTISLLHVNALEAHSRFLRQGVTIEGDLDYQANEPKLVTVALVPALQQNDDVKVFSIEDIHVGLNDRIHADGSNDSPKVAPYTNQPLQTKSLFGGPTFQHHAWRDFTGNTQRRYWNRNRYNVKQRTDLFHNPATITAIRITRSDNLFTVQAIRQPTRTQQVPDQAPSKRRKKTHKKGPSSDSVSRAVSGLGNSTTGADSDESSTATTTQPKETTNSSPSNTNKNGTKSSDFGSVDDDAPVHSADSPPGKVSSCSADDGANYAWQYQYVVGLDLNGSETHERSSPMVPFCSAPFQALIDHMRRRNPRFGVRIHLAETARSNDRIGSRRIEIGLRSAISLAKSGIPVRVGHGTHLPTFGLRGDTPQTTRTRTHGSGALVELSAGSLSVSSNPLPWKRFCDLHCHLSGAGSAQFWTNKFRRIVNQCTEDNEQEQFMQSFTQALRVAAMRTNDEDDGGGDPLVDKMLSDTFCFQDVKQLVDEGQSTLLTRLLTLPPISCHVLGEDLTPEAGDAAEVGGAAEAGGTAADAGEQHFDKHFSAMFQVPFLLLHQWGQWKGEDTLWDLISHVAEQYQKDNVVYAELSTSSATVQKLCGTPDARTRFEGIQTRFQVQIRFLVNVHRKTLGWQVPLTNMLSGQDVDVQKLAQYNISALGTKTAIERRTAKVAKKIWQDLFSAQSFDFPRSVPAALPSPDSTELTSLPNELFAQENFKGVEILLLSNRQLLSDTLAGRYEGAHSTDLYFHSIRDFMKRRELRSGNMPKVVFGSDDPAFSRGGSAGIVTAVNTAAQICKVDRQALLRALKWAITEAPFCDAATLEHISTPVE